METTFHFLDENTDPITKQILINVVKRKKQFDFYHQRHMAAIWVTFLLVSLYFLYVYFTIVRSNSDSFAAMFSAFVKDSHNLTFMIVTVGMYGYMNLLKNKKDKAEKEFHDLRCEIVDRSKDLWGKKEAWENRHLVFEIMKKEYNINLYHEKK